MCSLKMCSLKKRAVGYVLKYYGECAVGYVVGAYQKPSTIS